MATKRKLTLPGPMLIALTGARGAGKTTLAQAVVDRYVGWEHMSFADPVREAAFEHLRLEAHKDPIVSRWLHVTANPFGHGTKDEIIPGMGCTPRDVLIEIGEQARAQDPRYWIKKLEDRIVKTTHHVIIDDARFEPEAQWVIECGGVLVKVGIEPADGDIVHCELDIPTLPRARVEFMAGRLMRGLGEVGGRVI